MKNDSLNYIISNIYFKNLKELIKIEKISNIQEIRLRAGRPVIFCKENKDLFLDKCGGVTENISNAYIFDIDEVIKTLNIISQNSLYAFSNEISNGFITLKGGHRVGLVGRVIVENKKIKNIIDFSGLNFRIAREIIGCSDKIIKYFFEGEKLLNVLIVSPPGCGKTTLLRDISRNLSNGLRGVLKKGIKVGIVDERSEIAGCVNGVSMFDIGMRTDILDSCPKDLGIIMMIRTMSPNVIITDEIGNDDDIYAIKKSINSGVSIIASIHGEFLDNFKIRNDISNIIKSNIFDRIITLSFKSGPGTVSSIYDCLNNKYIF